jgi:hypothetical protein
VIINSDLNILGGLPDWNLITVFMEESIGELDKKRGTHSYTAIKTDSSVQRFKRAINRTLLKFKNAKVESLVRDIIAHERITNDSLYLLFWHASYNNELFHYLNSNVYFPAFYSGRISVKQDEVVACLKDLREKEVELKKWSDYTLEKVASKYLTLLKKFGLMEGTLNKTIVHPYLSDKMFVLFVYWLTSIESKANVLESEWLQYSFTEKPIFIERLMQKKFTKYFRLNYTGDKLKLEMELPYPIIYDAIK